MSIARLPAAWSALIVASCLAAPAYAGLGDAVAVDASRLRAASVKTVAMPLYDRHEIVTDDGATIHEFAARDGTVFAVDFAGPAIPDLQTMLGSHYADYLASARAHHGNHHVMSFDENGLVVTIVKLPRGFTGSAQVSALMPQGVTAEDLR
jgi:hypothetical protein